MDRPGWQVPMLPVYWMRMQILVELAELQDSEVGDGTTSVVILAAELLKKANELVRNKIHPTNIISGYRLAMREVCGLAAGVVLSAQQLQACCVTCTTHRSIHLSAHMVVGSLGTA